MVYERVHYLDYAKAFALFTVLLIHTGFPGGNNYVLFAIPLFFITVGYTYVPCRRTLKENIVSRFITVLLPFWGFMLFYIILELIRAPYIGYGDSRLAIPAFINMGYGSGYIPNNSGLFSGLLDFMHYVDTSSVSVDLVTPTNTHLWFLPALFTACVLFYSVIERTRKKWWSSVFSIITLIFLASLEVIVPQIKQLPYGLGRGFLGAAFMLTGFWMREYAIFNKKNAFTVVAMAVSFSLVLLSLLLGSTGRTLVISHYGPHGVFSVFMTFIGGTGAACFVLYLCKLIGLSPLTKIKAMLSLIGRNTMVIYAWHMALKFILDIFYIKIFREPICPDQFYMRLLPSNAWWYMILEVVVIIFVCILMQRLITRVKCKFRMVKAINKEQTDVQ